MTDLEQLIATGNRLCERLTIMAIDERKFGWDLCHRLEMINWEIEKSTNELIEIREYLVGGEA